MADTLVTIARTLCALDPREFTAARNAEAQKLKATNPALAKQVGALRKPSPAAWTVNLLCTETEIESEKQLAELMSLGRRMRSAQEQLDRDAMLLLTQQRRTAIAALTAAGTRLAALRGIAATSSVRVEVEQTLQAGTSDADAAAAVTSGLLVRALRSVGFEPVDLDGALAVPDSASGIVSRVSVPSTPVHITDARRRKEARLAADALEREAAAATDAVDALHRRSVRLEQRSASLEQETADLRERLSAAEGALAVIADEQRALLTAHAQAETTAEQAHRRARDAAEVADSLTTSG